MAYKLFLVVLLSLTVLLPTAKAQDPSKSVEIVVPFGPRGSMDRNAQAIAKFLPRYLDSAVKVIHRPGLAGETGTSVVIKRPPDGYTLLFTHQYFDQLRPIVRELLYDADRDLVTVAKINSGDFSLVVQYDSQFDSWADIVKFAKANPGKLSAAHSGYWGVTHTPLSQLLMESELADKIDTVRYRGGGPALKGHLNGEVDLSFQYKSTILTRKKKLRVMASAGTARLIASVPTFGELGFTNDIGMMHRIIQVRRDISKERLIKLRQAFDKLRTDRDYIRELRRIGETIEYMDGEEYEKLRHPQKTMFRRVVDFYRK